jgi:CRISPR-associated protein Csx10
MKQIELTIQALAPLAIGRKKPGSVSEASDFIRGSVIRGSVANQLLREGGSPEEGDHFHALFLNREAAVFGNAYPTVPDAATVSVIPGTVVSSKTHPGFRGSNGGNGAFDTLIDRFCAAEYGHPYDPSCPQDGDRVEPFSGVCSRNGDSYRNHSVPKRLLTRVGINRRRATAEEQILYSLEVLSERNGNQPSYFQSTVQVADDQLAERLAAFINQRQRRFRLGGSRSRGLGKVAMAAQVREPDSSLSSRVAAFNRTLRDRWEMWGVFGLPQQSLDTAGTFFSLDMQAEAILRENWLRTTVISPAMLSRFADVDDPSLQLHATYSSYDYLSGWNEAWGLMKDLELVTEPGAVYLFSTERPEAWQPALERLEHWGLGQRRSEGFGQLQVCHELHQVMREEAV